ncbi:DUF1559 domain-containing protein [Tundrisphaera lichenicola]|uniref:DUF1559 family PulG-like putative transporter n=1 Tax=Tundrisphaera lichenicola TaxID=2029860 RepID=UPI003EB9B5DF
MIVVVGLLAFFLMWVFIALPQGREKSRMVGCQQNLMQIGKGLELYHQANRRFPSVPELGTRAGTSPIQAMLEGLVLPDLTGISDTKTPPKPTTAPPRGTRVPGLACPSDSNAMAGLFDGPISYRANTGASTSGQGGPFAPGRSTSIPEVEAADGLAYTASFAERLVGNGRDGQPARENYARPLGPIGPDGCPSLGDDLWKGDAGSDWAEASWRSTLYGHALTPNATPSCIAEDGRTAAIGASSAHPNRVNVLMLDGSLRGITPTIDPKIWRAMGTIGTANP